MGTDQTDEWESEISRRQGPKFKTQLKVIEEGLDMVDITFDEPTICLLYTSPSPRDRQKSRMPSSA